MQAIIYKILPFDAESGTTIKFMWNGNQVFKNRCIIKNNETTEIVYDNTITSFKLEHTIDLSQVTLENGVKYEAFITVFDRDNNESDIQPLGNSFICLKTPVFQFINLSEGQTIKSSSYEFILNYSQENNELLDSWSITVYTKSHTVLTSSGIKYDTSSLTYLISGFSNNTEYIIRAEGQTVNGMLIDTGDINITVSYSSSNIFSMLDPVNVRERGAIYLRSNIVSSEGKLDKEGVYLDNGFLDLRDNILTYEEGFLFHDNFSYVMKFYGMKPNDTVLQMFDNTGTYFMSVIYRISKVNEGGQLIRKSLFELRIINNGINEIHYSNKLPLISDTDIIALKIVRQSGLFDIEIHHYGIKGGS